MFLRRRDLTPEYFDSPERTSTEISEHYEWLARMNKLTQFDRPFRIWIPQLLGAEACKQLSIVDLGAGNGMLGRTLTEFARGHGWDWRFTNVDLNLPQPGIHGSTSATWVKASVTDLPFAANSFDLAIGSTMTHHLNSDADVSAHFREARRVARQSVLICDMIRSPFFLVALWAVLVALRAPKEFRQDGVQSVKRGWRESEWRRLAALAGLNEARVWSEHGTRILLAHSLRGDTAEQTDTNETKGSRPSAV